MTAINTDLMKWLNMVWSALDEPNSSKRIHLLEDANSFLEQLREQAPELAAAQPDLSVRPEPLLHAS